MAILTPPKPDSEPEIVERVLPTGVMHWSFGDDILLLEYLPWKAKSTSIHRYDVESREWKYRNAGDRIKIPTCGKFVFIAPAHHHEECVLLEELAELYSDHYLPHLPDNITAF